MLKEKLAILTVVIMIGSTVLTACGPLPEPAAVQETAAAEVVASATPPAPEPTKLPPAETPEAETAELEGLWYPIDEEPLTLDMQRAEDDFLIIGQCIEGLFEYRGDGSIEPTGATGFEVSDDGLVYTIHLRPEAVWSDGEPVVAQHYVDGVIRMLEPETGAEYAFGMYDVEGAEAFNTGETADPTTVGVRAVDDYTLEIRLAAPASYFETILAFDIFSPVRLDIIEEHGDLWTEPGNYLSNGPYLLDEWVHGERLVLVKNPAYWNADGVSIERITLPIIPDRAEQWAMYENDELHVYAWGDLREKAPDILADPVRSQEYRTLNVPGLIYFGLNTLRPPTDDVRVRQALAMAIDHEAFLAEMFWWIESPPPSCTIPPNIMGHQPYGTCGYTYDPERARALLAEAGYPDGEGFPPLQRWAHFGAWQTDALETVAGMWEETLGITTEAHVHDWDVYGEYLDGCVASREALAACDLNVYVLNWAMDYGDPQNLLEVVFAPSSPLQATGWESDRYEELMELARTELDTAQRAEYYKEADKILVEEQAAVIPIIHLQLARLVKRGVTVEFPPFGVEKFKHWALP
jgi:oligopeptide transport system substrate-binding protein